jgi:GNAT superfamily N-acetyltransferase
MIREATLDDLARIMELGDRFLEVGPYKGRVKNHQQSEQFAKAVITTIGKVLLWVEDDGRISGILAFLLLPHYFTGELTAQEIMWYVEPEYRKGCAALRLMWAAEEMARNLGAVTMQFTAPTRETSAIYQRFGYKPLEMTFEKEFATCRSH